MGDSPKWVKSKKRRRRRETERWWKQWPSYAWRTQARMAHASRLGQKHSQRWYTKATGAADWMGCRIQSVNLFWKHWSCSGTTVDKIEWQLKNIFCYHCPLHHSSLYCLMKSFTWTATQLSQQTAWSGSPPVPVTLSVKQNRRRRATGTGGDPGLVRAGLELSVSLE